MALAIVQQWQTCMQMWADIHLTRPRHRAKCNSSRRLHTNQDEEIRTQQKLQSPKPLVTEEKKHKHNTSSPYFVMLSFKNYISFSTGSIFKSFKLLIWLTLRLSNHRIWLSVPQMNPVYTYNPSVAHIRTEWITLTINSASSAIWVSGFYQIMIIIFSHFFFF